MIMRPNSVKLLLVLNPHTTPGKVKIILSKENFIHMYQDVFYKSIQVVSFFMLGFEIG